MLKIWNYFINIWTFKNNVKKIIIIILKQNDL